MMAGLALWAHVLPKCPCLACRMHRMGLLLWHFDCLPSLTQVRALLL